MLCNFLEHGRGSINQGFICVFIELFILINTSLKFSQFGRLINVLIRSLKIKRKNCFSKFKIYYIIFKMVAGLTAKIER